MTEEIFNIAKDILFDKERSQLEHIGGLYLLYSIYFKQPTCQFCKIKINLEKWNLLKSFINKLNSDKNNQKKQAVHIFYKLLQSNAFR